MPLKFSTNKSSSNNLLKPQTIDMTIQGFKEPKIILQEGRNFTIVKETKDKNDNNNVGVIVTKNINDTELKVTTNINHKIHHMGGTQDFYYKKYLKYKIKYLNLKNSLS